jgi:hypothetical protein
LRFHEIFFSSFSLCLPPRLQPPPIVDGGDLPEVTVLVGTKLRYQIGYVRYNGGEEEFISSEVIGAISAITAILVSIGIVVLIVLKHKSTQVINLIIWNLKITMAYQMGYYLVWHRTLGEIIKVGKTINQECKLFKFGK